MGWADSETERLRRVVAELEAKNSALLEENIELRRKLGLLPAVMSAREAGLPAAKARDEATERVTSQEEGDAEASGDLR